MHLRHRRGGDLRPGVHRQPQREQPNDTLYWAILTLTGIGQPFEVVTAGGRAATVLSIAVALIVVPGQLAKLATVAGAQDIMRGMGMNDDDDEDAFSDEAVDAYVSGEWEELETAQSPSASFGMGFAGPGPLGGFIPAMQTVPRPRKRDAPSKQKRREARGVVARGAQRRLGAPGAERRRRPAARAGDAAEGVDGEGVRAVRAADPRGGREVLPAVRGPARARGGRGPAVRAARRGR